MTPKHPPGPPVTLGKVPVGGFLSKDDLCEVHYIRAAGAKAHYRRAAEEYSKVLDHADVSLLRLRR